VDLEVIHHHLGVRALMLLPHMLHDQLRVALNQEPHYFEVTHNSETSLQGFILGHVIGGSKLKLYHVVHLLTHWSNAEYASPNNSKG
jgi:hypothetical protein